MPPRDPLGVLGATQEPMEAPENPARHVVAVRFGAFGACLAVAAVLALGCDSGAPRKPQESPRVPGVGSFPRPEEPYVEHGVCPFECCQYGPWVAASTVQVFPAAGDTSRVLFVLNAGDSVRADSGLVSFERVGIVVVARPRREGIDGEQLPSGEVTQGGGLDLAPGDTIIVLASAGEGVFHVWYHGRSLWLQAFWPDPRIYPPPTGARVVQEAREQWWVHVTDRIGRSGWVKPTGGDGLVFDGADACS